VLTLLLKKRLEGGSSLTLERADGTRTWQRQTKHAQFFAAHDLTHYAVESVLGLSGAFYGLIAQGWEFEHFERPFPRGPVPAEALWAERLVGLLDVDRHQGASAVAPMSAAELNALLDEKYEPPPAPRHLSDVELQSIRQRLSESLAKWEALPAGETLVLKFPPDAST
jgi:hypothetical protein